jgi:hypothetical protein
MDCHISGDGTHVVTCASEYSANASFAGVIVGKTSWCSGIYTKHLTIDSDVKFHIYPRYNAAVGAYIYGASPESSITINGDFTIGSFTGETNGISRITGVCFGSTDPGSIQTVNGTFRLRTNGFINITSSFSLLGVCFEGGANGDLTINGAFIIDCTPITRGLAEAYGVCFDSAVTGKVTINGAFTISSFPYNENYGNFESESYGVCFKSVVSGDIIINGAFTVSACTPHDTYTTSYSSIGYGVRFCSAVSANITVNGTFTIFTDSCYSTNSTEAKSYAVAIDTIISGYVTIDGAFLLYSSCSNNSAYYKSSFNYGVRFGDTPTCFLKMESKFFSNTQA